MVPRRQFYDPFIEDPNAKVSDMPDEFEAIHGLVVDKPGLYLHIDDVVSMIKKWAADNQNDALLLEAAAAFAGMIPEHPPAVDLAPVDAHPEIARIEIYPDTEGKWYARPVSSYGSILTVTDGSFDRDYVERDAAARWPGKEIFELTDAMGDSIWDEEDHNFGFNGRRRPSPRRLWS